MSAGERQFVGAYQSGEERLGSGALATFGCLVQFGAGLLFAAFIEQSHGFNLFVSYK